MRRQIVCLLGLLLAAGIVPAGASGETAEQVRDRRPAGRNGAGLVSPAGRASPINSSELAGVDGHVYALTVYDDRLVAAGAFTMAGGTEVDFIAAWDGTGWSPLGSGMNGAVRALTVYDGQLIAGGSFTTAGGIAAPGIAAWDGNEWSPLGIGPGAARALTVYDGQLIANVSSWDGTGWSTLGDGVNREVTALTVYDGKLIVGGYFDQAGGAPANHIAAWDGTSWSALGAGMTGRAHPFHRVTVRALTVFGGRLIAGGHFLNAGGAVANHIASWDGADWSALGRGIDQGCFDLVVPAFVHALTVFEGKLIAGGYFDWPGDLIAAWDGSEWSSLNSRMDCEWEVFAMTVYDGQLIAGGSFNYAGGVVVNHIAAWDGESWSALEPRDVRQAVLDIRPGSCPNPINGNSARGPGKAVLPAAILGAEDFDVHEIDPATVTLGGISPVRWQYQDLGSPADDSENGCACSNPGPDGYDDLMLMFYTAETIAFMSTVDIDRGRAGGNQPAVTVSGLTEEVRGASAPGARDGYVLTIEGQFYDGSIFEGQDCVKLVGEGRVNASSSTVTERVFELRGNYPNPFNPSTMISFYLSKPAHVRLEIYNVMGGRVATLMDQALDSGEYSVPWNGDRVASGVYYYRILAGDQAATRKILLLK